MNTTAHPSTVNMPLVFSENDTFALAELLVTVAKEQPITPKQREFAAMLFVRMESTVKATIQDRQSRQTSTALRPDLRPAPMFNCKNRKGR